MPLKPHFRRAHADENQRVREYWKKGNPSFRAPASGGGFWKGDVFVVLDKCIRNELVRRAEVNKCPKCNGQKHIDNNSNVLCPKCDGVGTFGGDRLVFRNDEINSTIEHTKKVAQLLGVPYQIFLVAHFPKYKTWRIINWQEKECHGEVEMKI